MRFDVTLIFPDQLAWALDSEGRDETSATPARWPSRLKWAALVALLCVTSVAVAWLSLELSEGPPAPVPVAATAPAPAPAPRPKPVLLSSNADNEFLVKIQAAGLPYTTAQNPMAVVSARAICGDFDVLHTPMADEVSSVFHENTAPAGWTPRPDAGASRSSRDHVLPAEVRKSPDPWQRCRGSGLFLCPYAPRGDERGRAGVRGWTAVLGLDGADNRIGTETTPPRLALR